MARKPRSKSDDPNKGTPIYTSIPAWLYDAVQADAKKNRRSLAAQIAMTLEEKYPFEAKK